MKNLFFVFMLALTTSAFACGDSDKSADTDTSTEENKTEEVKS